MDEKYRGAIEANWRKLLAYPRTDNQGFTMIRIQPPPEEPTEDERKKLQSSPFNNSRLSTRPELEQKDVERIAKLAAKLNASKMSSPSVSSLSPTKQQYMSANSNNVDPLDRRSGSRKVRYHSKLFDRRWLLLTAIMASTSPGRIFWRSDAVRRLR